ncbi:flagellar hook-associated protein FlgK [Phenylobacterium aquaticum]|uniref:flagellar hook-associated protein FlgK n=1 Tax=Phenylobacterium aquaticum TaxID=1763816 RepID=UPI0026F2CDA5|nr:flagellar hook-associated protein FlgK [Phenylobacterium aquaticum]
MSLSIAMKTAASGLIAAQTGLRTVSDNIANVNTTGYVRKTVDQQPLVVGGMGMGVEITGINRVTDQYLQGASMTATSDSAKWGSMSQYLDNAQGLFGDPSGDSFFFTRLDNIWSSFSAAGNDPSSSLMRGQALSSVQDFVNEAQRINTQITSLGDTVDAQAQTDITNANDLLKQINSLNSDISRARLSRGDSSGSENIQSSLVDQLSKLLSIQVTPRENGGVTVRTEEGFQLAGDQAATLSYNRTDATKAFIAIEPSGGVGSPQPIAASSGQVRALMDLRDKNLPGLADQLGEFMNEAANRINAVHNASTAVPAPTSLTGRDTGLDLPTAIAHFTGKSTVAVVDNTGVVQQTVAIDFDAHTMSVNGGAGTGFADASFLTDLNNALGGTATASFSGGALTLAATGTNGVAIDEGTSMKAGRAFSHFFGLNDLVRSTGGPTNYDTGMTASDANGYTPGDTIAFRLALANGKPVFDVSVPVPAAPSDMQGLVDALNATGTGVGQYGQFSLNANGKLAFKATTSYDITLSVTADHTQRGIGGPSISKLFGLSTFERTSRASRLQVDPTLTGDPTKLALAQLDLTATPPASSIRPGDGRGGASMSQAGDVLTSFDAAGTLGSVTMSLSRYASEFGGAVGRTAQAADTSSKSATSVANEATSRRQATEGVNIDEELVRLTTYQQAFNASARMITAAKDMFDVLTNMI